MNFEEEITTVFHSYFKNMFITSFPSKEDMEQCTQFFKPKVTATINNLLTKAYTKEEVNAALKQMGPFKSPSLDGFGACFYQNH